MALLDITNVVGASPSWTLTVLDSAGVSVGDYVTAPIVGLPVGDYGIYRVSDVPDAFTIDVEDDVAPNSPYGEPSAGTGSSYTSTTAYNLSQVPDGGPGWGEAIRRDFSVLDQELYRASGDATLEPITMQVDYATGVRPPNGTVVRTQAEYDALGAPLKYVQDAEAIRPRIVNHQIIVELAAGEHYRDTTRVDPGTYAPILMLFGFTSTNTDEKDYNNLFGGLTGQMAFRGATNTLESSIPGTWGVDLPDANTREFVRSDGGTWTPEEHRGNFVLCTSGVNAGSKWPIVDNTADTLIITASNSNGVGEVDIYELTSSLSNLDGPGGTAGFYNIVNDFGQGYPGLQSRYAFHDMILGPADGSGYTFLGGGQIYMVNCKGHGYFRYDPGDITIGGCYWDIPATALGQLYFYGAIDGEVILSLYDNVIRSALPGDILYIRQNVSGGLARNRIIAEPGYTGNMVSLVFGVDLESSSGTPMWIEGNGDSACYGLYCVGHGIHLQEGSWLRITDCGRAVFANQAVGCVLRAIRNTSENNTIMYYLSASPGLIASTAFETDMYTTTFLQIDGDSFTLDDIALRDTVHGNLGSSFGSV